MKELRFEKREKKQTINDEIDSILKDMKTMDCTSDDFKKAAMNLELLCKAKSYDGNVVSKDTIVKSVVSLATVGMILKHEELNVIATKALNFIPKIF